MLLTVAQFRAHMLDEVAMTDEPLRVMLDANEALIDERVGPLSGSTETIVTNGRQHIIPLKDAPQTITEVTEDGVVLETTDYESWHDDWLRRVDQDYPDTVERVWGRTIRVEYVPKQNAAVRIMTLVKLMQADLNFNPGMTVQSAGGWQEVTASDQYEVKQSILDELKPRALFA